MVEEGGSHLGASGVVLTDKQNLGDVGQDASSNLGEGPKPLAGEPLG